MRRIRLGSEASASTNFFSPWSFVTILPVWKSRMKPSSLRTWAICALTLVAGISTTGNSTRLALRIRVSMSAIGSVIMARGLPLPAGFLDAGDEAVGGQVAEANPADAELAEDGPGPAAQPATQADADLVARPQLHLGRVLLVALHLRQVPAEFNHLRFGGHSKPFK